MSIATEISRISQNVSDSLDAVAAKGVTVPSGSTSDDLPSLIAQIQTSSGGGITITDTTDSHGGTIRTITGTFISGTKQITANGTNIDVTSYAAVDVAVPTPTPSLQAKTNISPTTSSQTIQADSGYDGLSSVQINAMPSGTAGTPTATKGTVSNHSVSVTPSVTNTTGYITGSTKTGTAVTVSASELVSGSETKTQNGTYDVTNLAELIVNVASSGIDVKTATGTFTGDGSRDITFSCDFEPDVVYWTSNPGTTASTGVVAGIIVRSMMAASRYRNNTTSNSHYAMIDITGMNTGGSSYSYRATYNSTDKEVTLYCWSSNARTYFVNGRTYTFQCVKYTA